MKGALNMARLSWAEMVRAYPNMWVAVRDAEMDGADIVSGEVVEARSDREMRQFRMRNRNAGYVFRRTSEGNFNGHIDSDFRIRVDQA